MKIVQAHGQTCNQFWIYTNYIADCIEHNNKIAIWVPDQSIKHFPNLKNSEYLSFPLYSERIMRILGYDRYIKFLTFILLNKYVLSITKIIIDHIPGFAFEIASVTCKKSKFRFKHSNELKLIFAPDINITTKVTDLFTEVRLKYDVIVGIHIRQGDYRTYLNGMYFYSIPDYYTFMHNLEKQFNGKKVIFFIASNENINLSLFANLQCFSVPDSIAANDIFGLSLCDYLCGPPSTFSAWASYYNRTPLYFINDINKKVTTNDFFYIEDIWL